jgi:hypothetical protein
MSPGIFINHIIYCILPLFLIDTLSCYIPALHQAMESLSPRVEKLLPQSELDVECVGSAVDGCDAGNARCSWLRDSILFRRRGNDYLTRQSAHISASAVETDIDDDVPATATKSRWDPLSRCQEPCLLGLIGFVLNENSFIRRTTATVVILGRFALCSLLLMSPAMLHDCNVPSMA